MKILVACEFSGIVREAFKARGHDVWSCDLLPTEIPGQHIQGDVLEILEDGWDMMIAHPPCTYLSYAGTAYWNNPGRAEKREAAMEFFMHLYNANIPRVCIENPVGCPNVVFRQPDQIVHPYFFGDRELKRTCLWLRGLPRLSWNETDTLFEKKSSVDSPAPKYVQKNGKKRYFTDSISGYAKNRQSIRSCFWPGIAAAMAEQWGAETGITVKEQKAGQKSLWT